MQNQSNTKLKKQPSPGPAPSSNIDLKQIINRAQNQLNHYRNNPRFLDSIKKDTKSNKYDEIIKNNVTNLVNEIQRSKMSDSQVISKIQEMLKEETRNDITNKDINTLIVLFMVNLINEKFIAFKGGMDGDDAKVVAAKKAITVKKSMGKSGFGQISSNNLIIILILLGLAYYFYTQKSGGSLFGKRRRR